MRNDGLLLGLGAEFVVLLIGGAFSFPFVFFKVVWMIEFWKLCLF